ncbi:uncharacterized protein LOC125198388 isoform X1 [Salvia hispanica]|uniref:uncharacterized protein LOC125187393 n=1 Tax=Salvia hispanica TaxID=49212 RepID=UPI002008F641|nr:uncharacterized protein LOC125187393 [Salvia hispanica]XP_047952699.1 uncharacterized protein LOC125198388 isoform X1 [Salvia hispanica]
MTSSPFPITVTLKHHRHRRPSPPKHYVSAITPNHFMSFRSPSSFSNNLHPSFPFFKRNYRFHRCCATNSPSEPPPENQIPPGASPKDTLQIFFAVLFWMSLFFWSCAWDRGNSGRSDKGPRFRK